MAGSDISSIMAMIARSQQAQFTLNGRPMMMEEVFSLEGLLPGMARRADQLSALCMGYGIGATFEEAEGTPLGVRVIFDDITPNGLRVLCLVDVMMELMKSASPGMPAQLDQLLYD